MKCRHSRCAAAPDVNLYAPDALALRAHPLTPLQIRACAHKDDSGWEERERERERETAALHQSEIN